MFDLTELIPPEGYSEEQERYFRTAEEFYKKFGTQVPRAQYPQHITDEQVIQAMEACIASGKNEMERLLGITIISKAIY